MKKVVLGIEGMTCSACSNKIEKYLNKQDGVKSASVNLVMNTASIEYDDKKISTNDLDRFIAESGYKSLGEPAFEKENKNIRKEKYGLIVLLIITILTLYISMGPMIMLPSIPYLDMKENATNYVIAQIFLSLISIILGRDIIKKGFKNLLHLSPNMDSLVTIGVLASFLYSSYEGAKIISGEIGNMHNLYFESTVVVIFFIKIGRFIENKNKNKTKEAIQKLVTITPKYANIIKDGMTIKVTIDEIKMGDIVVCRPGEKIAVDGTIIDGETHIDESFITGESTPFKRSIGDKVIAGSINYEGSIMYKAEKIGVNSTVSEIVKHVVEATNTKAPIAKVADKVSGYFVPTAIAIAIMAFVVWYLITKDFNMAINIFVSVLVVACPCSLGLATPLAVVIAQGKCSQRGILVKSSEALENANKIKTVCFDKTGTLTEGALSISKFYNYSDESDTEIIKAIASIENSSEHPIAKALVNYAKENNIELETISNFKNLPGMGVYAEIKKDSYYIGNRKLLDRILIETKYEKAEDRLKRDGNSILYVVKNGAIVALVGVKDVLRDKIEDVIAKIKSRGIDVVMLTGDNEETAKRIADEIGIDHVIANISPKEKAKEIEKLKANGRVMMCGDGVNDSVSLVKADIGVAISNGTDIAIDSADVVLMTDNIDRINDLMDISSKTIRNIKQNLFWAFFYNICMIPIAGGALHEIGIMLNPMIASAAMTLSSLTVVLNALRLTKIKGV